MKANQDIPYRKLGNTDIEITPIGLGVMQFAGTRGVFRFMFPDVSQGDMNTIIRTAIEEMKHIELLAERIIFLGGDVELTASTEVKKIQDVGEMLAMGIKMEQGSVRDYNIWANECSANADSGSKKVFEGLVDDEERHYDQYDNEKNNLERFGDRYLALQSIEMSKRAATTAASAE